MKKKSTTKQYVSPCVPSTFWQLKPHVFSKAAFYYVRIWLKWINYRFYVTFSGCVVLFACQTLCSVVKVFPTCMTNDVAPTVQTQLCQTYNRKLTFSAQSWITSSSTDHILQRLRDYDTSMLIVWSGSRCHVSFRWPSSEAAAWQLSHVLARIQQPLSPELMQNSTVCQREPTWCPSTVRMNRMSGPTKSSDHSEGPDSDSVAFTKTADGCGLMVAQWTLTFVRTRAKECGRKWALRTQQAQIWNGMMFSGSCLKVHLFSFFSISKLIQDTIMGWSSNVFVKYDPETSHFSNNTKTQARWDVCMLHQFPTCSIQIKHLIHV